ncbi:MAG: hypothetical protein H7837_03115 [Magnetococcus sp. MYC-9]
MEQAPVVPELRKRMNRMGVMLFVLALLLVCALTFNFTRQYDPAVRAEQKAQKQQSSAERTEKK